MIGILVVDPVISDLMLEGAKFLALVLAFWSPSWWPDFRRWVKWKREDRR